MRPFDVLSVVLVVGALLLWLAWVRASRLDRLHRKVAQARSVVHAQLIRRATVAAELATCGLLDPVGSVVLGESAWRALTASTSATPVGLRELLDLATVPDQNRPALEPAESELTATLTELLADPDEADRLREDPLGGELLEQLAAAWYRVQLARRFHNEAVAQTLRVRRGRLTRLFRLAGHAPAPQTCELDDAWPQTLAGYGGDGAHG